MLTAHNRNSTSVFLRWLVTLAASWVLIGACIEFFQIAWGTGVWLGQFAPTWFALLVCFILISAAGVALIAIMLWQPQRFSRAVAALAAIRARLGLIRWGIAVVLLFVPVYILQYTFWGIVLHGPYLRTLLFILLAIMAAWLLTKTQDHFMDWNALVVSLVLLTAVVSIFASMGRVTTYPFSLGWSEGNRLWDYSVMFRRDLYDYPPDKPIPVFLDDSRQFVGGIPFLFPGVKIQHVRFWLALVDIIPYLLLGWLAFYQIGKRSRLWMLAGVWAFLFVRQGPVHAPLLICAILVALAWKRPLWLAVPLILAAGYLAVVSRFTWLFAPAMWSVMLEFARAPELNKAVWRRSIAVGIAGVFGGYAAPFLVRWIQSIGQVTGSGGGGVSLSTIEAGLTSQPLIWSRLFPNQTYGPGILLGLFVAVLPLIGILIYAVRSRQWQLTGLQKASVVLPLLAFLVVGLVVSTKIGGGGDLHNLDMFMIGLMFAAAIAWHNGGAAWIRNVEVMPAWIAGMVIAMLLLPGLRPLMELRPLSITKDTHVVATLADIEPMDPLPDPLPDTLPAAQDTQRALQNVQKTVNAAASSGEVLFMDQRQLLTFGYVDVPLVPEYDKKLLIDMAMAENPAYFESFYQDLETHRFSLIVTNPINRRLDREEGHFDEENNAWVKWVTRPLLCYYEPLDRLKKVDVELLVPRKIPMDCSSELP